MNHLNLSISVDPVLEQASFKKCSPHWSKPIYDAVAKQVAATKMPLSCHVIPARANKPTFKYPQKTFQTRKLLVTVQTRICLIHLEQLQGTQPESCSRNGQIKLDFSHNLPGISGYKAQRKQTIQQNI